MRMLLYILASLPYVQAAAQDLNVVETWPGASQTDVALQSIVTFTFSEPIDTTARFDGQRVLAFYSATPHGVVAIEGPAISQDLTEVSYQVTHRDSTDYAWMLTGARSRQGTALCHPEVLTYTTHPDRGMGVVRGFAWIVFVTKRSDCLDTGVAALLDRPPDSSAVVLAAAKVDENGAFAFEHVRPGTYWPVLLMDYDRDGTIRPSWDDAPLVDSEVGIYDPDHDGEPDSLVVDASTDVEITLRAYGVGTERSAELPGTARLLPVYPNPSTGEATVAFALERPLRLRLEVYDVRGRRVSRISHGLFSVGRHALRWAPTGLPAGVYLVRMETAAFTLARTIVLIR